MIISKAIEILEDIIHYVEPGDPPEEHQAAQLGIEALKRIQDCRHHPFSAMYSPLLGESMPDRGIR